MKTKSNLRGGDWFGCGRTITQESWDRFTQAYRLHHWKFDGKVSCRNCGEMFETLNPDKANCPRCDASNPSTVERNTA